MLKNRVKYGSSRTVLLIGNVAIKFPAFSTWEHFLIGIVANLRESNYYKWFKCDIIHIGGTYE